MRSRRDQIQGVIENLNAIGVGELGTIDGRLAKARDDVRALQAGEVEQAIEDGRAALAKGDLSNFRRLVAQAVSRLGHLK